MRIGVDFGGSKIEAIALDEMGRERLRRRIPTPGGEYEAIVRAIADLVLEMERELGRRCPVGVGTPGSLSPTTGLLRNSNTVCLNGRPLDRDLAAAVGRPVRLYNDANCFALSEAMDGAGLGAAVVFGVILGTGTGGGIVVNGFVVNGRNAVGGEWGHNPLPWPRAEEWPGPPCYCGRTGCIETFLSGPGLARDHEGATGQRLVAAEVVERASAGDVSAEETLRRYEERLARSLAHVINILDPDVIVLGGGLSNVVRLYDNVPPQWGRWVFSDTVTTKLLPAVHGDSSGVRGAAWLWPA